ncbi:DUF5594 family protein [Burkholderia glumae]|uniref:DUF5594 family protein n=1 Tax=Burkholderia glumae TaxID=337 RepID=UPI001AE1FB59|nr:DUF5594 family protein [Burkholderia glumae]QTP33763.1 hypothetical protein B7759_02367 [Burkholderia glumae]
MKPDTAHRFDTELAPRIAARIARMLGPRVRVVAVRYGGHGHPSQIHVVSTTPVHVRGFDHPLDVTLTWDGDEIERLVADQDGARFARYLNALSCKLPGWESARGLDFGSRTQTTPHVLLGGLDFEA